jgi:hypothetical protein
MIVFKTNLSTFVMTVIAAVFNGCASTIRDVGPLPGCNDIRIRFDDSRRTMRGGNAIHGCHHANQVSTRDRVARTFGNGRLLLTPIQ